MRELDAALGDATRVLLDSSAIIAFHNPTERANPFGGARICVPLDLVVAVQAANLRAVMNLAAADSIVIASGLLAGCEAIITNDQRWKRRGEALFSEFRWIYLEDYC